MLRLEPISIPCYSALTGRKSKSVLNDRHFAYMLIYQEGKQHIVPDFILPRKWLFFIHIKIEHPDFTEPTRAEKIVTTEDKRREAILRCHDHLTAGHEAIIKTFWKSAESYF